MSTEVVRSVKAMVASPKFLEEAGRALPAHIDRDRFARIALTAVLKTPGLADCSIESVMQCLMDCAYLGLEPNTPLGLAYVIPYGKVATLQVGYQGYIQLAYRSGKVRSIYAELVYSKDEFSIELGLDRKLTHKGSVFNPDRGEVIGGYAVAHVDGADPMFITMPVEEIEGIRRRSKASGKGPWVTDWHEMVKKTLIRRLRKTIPQVPEIQDAATREELSAESAGIYLQSAPTDASTIARLKSKGKKAISEAPVSEVGEVAPEPDSPQEGAPPEAETGGMDANEMRAEIEARILKLRTAKQKVFVSQHFPDTGSLDDVPDEALSQLLDILDSGEWS